MLTANWAVQPRSFGTFDEYGCEWATDINHAYRLAQTFGEDCVIWRCPHVGEPMAWVSVNVTTESVEAVAQ